MYNVNSRGTSHYNDTNIYTYNIHAKWMFKPLKGF